MSDSGFQQHYPMTAQGYRGPQTENPTLQQGDYPSAPNGVAQPGYPSPPPDHMPVDTNNPPPQVGYSAHASPLPTVTTIPQCPPPLSEGFTTKNQEGQQPLEADLQLQPAATDVPPGLEYLAELDHIFVLQMAEPAEVYAGVRVNKKFDICNSSRQRFLYAEEQTDGFTRNFLVSLHHFNMKISDNTNQEIIHLFRPLRCQSCCCPCCMQKMEVESPPGTIIGYIVQQWHPCKAKLSVQDVSKKTLLMIIGPSCGCCYCNDVNFKVQSADESSSVGLITKQWGGFAREAMTGTTDFEIQFPIDLDVKVKALLLGATVLIKFMFFEAD
ncbi:phospholipid scramblase 1-like [Protopterus annectens]|uniref:phospholipid scramblase 1-like n=1 Tax=Protopterus annectens TaxID=7888 RepID=UPI001CF94E33|nr:phospholipid scramblase 1-like [Protopterus annectens]